MKKIVLLSAVFILLTVGCKKEEIDNELVGTQWEQVDSYSTSGMQYYPDGNWWGQYHQVNTTKTVITFLDNHNGKRWMKNQISNTAQNKTDTDVIFDVTLDFTYNYDSQKKRGELIYIYDSQELGDYMYFELSNGTDFELSNGTDFDIVFHKKEDFGLFFDSYDFWLGDKTNVFVLSK